MALTAITSNTGQSPSPLFRRYRATSTFRRIISEPRIPYAILTQREGWHIKIAVHQQHRVLPKESIQCWLAIMDCVMIKTHQFESPPGIRHKCYLSQSLLLYWTLHKQTIRTWKRTNLAVPKGLTHCRETAAISEATNPRHMTSDSFENVSSSKKRKVRLGNYCQRVK